MPIPFVNNRSHYYRGRAFIYWHSILFDSLFCPIVFNSSHCVFNCLVLSRFSLGQNGGEVLRGLWAKIHRWDALWLIDLILVILVILECNGLLFLMLRSASQGGFCANAHKGLRKLWMDFLWSFLRLSNLFYRFKIGLKSITKLRNLFCNIFFV